MVERNVNGYNLVFEGNIFEYKIFKCWQEISIWKSENINFGKINNFITLIINSGKNERNLLLFPVALCKLMLIQKYIFMYLCL